MDERQAEPSVRAILRSSSLLNALGDEEVEALAAISSADRADRGAVIWMDGSDVGFFGIVGTGFVKIVRTSATGQELTAEIMGPGQVFGLLGAIEGTGCPLSARAVCPTLYLRVPKVAFLEVYGQNASLKDQLVRRTTLRLRGAIDMMARMASGKVEQRIAAVLLVLAESYGVQTGSGVHLTIPLSRQDIAELAGTTVETTIRVTSRWTKVGILGATYRQITIRDPDRLLEHLEP